MVDNVLLEKRNRYLGKLIKKTQNLTESVKLLSIIDKELYSQSGGRISDEINRLSKPVVVRISGPNSLAGLNNVVKQLQTTIQKYSNFEESLHKIKQAVVYMEAPTNLQDMQLIIKKIQESVGILDKHEIIIITNFLTDQTFNTAAHTYVESAKVYNETQTPENRDKLNKAWEDLDFKYNEYKSRAENEQYQEILQVVFDWLYPKPSFNESAPSRAGSSSLTGPSSLVTVGKRKTEGKVNKRETEKVV
jgi:hypothetical protein